MRHDSVTEAFLLKQQPLSEADVLGTWFSRDLGKVRAVVMSARRPHSRLAAALLPGAVVTIRLVGRHEQGLFKVAGVPATQLFIRTFSEQQTIVYSWALEAVAKSTPDMEPHPVLFDAATRLFARLADVAANPLATTALLFLIDLLEALGMTPEHAVDPARGVWFDPTQGGFTGAPSGDGARAVDPQVFDRYVQLRRLAAGVSVPEYAAVDPLLLRLLEQLLEYYLDRPLRSFSFLSDIL